MNKYRKTFSQKNKKKNTLRKTSKRNYMLKNKYKKINYKTKITLNKKRRKRYQIGCSRSNNLKGGGPGVLQLFSNTTNTVQDAFGSLQTQFAGITSSPSSSPI